MREYSDSQAAFERAFLIAFLLTGSVKDAERVVCESISRQCLQEMSLSNLVAEAARYAVYSTQESQASEGRMQYRVTLPEELIRVADLPLKLRHCFVLRFLLGMSSSECTYLLKITTKHLEDHVCEAAQLIARTPREHALSCANDISISQVN